MPVYLVNISDFLQGKLHLCLNIIQCICIGFNHHLCLCRNSSGRTGYLAKNREWRQHGQYCASEFGVDSHVWKCRDMNELEIQECYTKANHLISVANANGAASFALGILELSDFDSEIMKTFVVRFVSVDKDAQAKVRTEIFESKILRNAKTHGSHELATEWSSLMTKMLQPQAELFSRFLSCLSEDGKLKVMSYLDSVVFGEPQDYCREVMASRQAFLDRIDQWFQWTDAGRS